MNIAGRPVIDGIWTCHCGHQENVGNNILKASNAALHIREHLPKNGK